MITNGLVKVNDVVVKSQVLVDPGRDQVVVEGKPLKLDALKETLYHFVINKPKGYTCSNASAPDKPGKRVVDLLQPWLDSWEADNKGKGLLPPRFFTVGRLDVATTGLIFVTNDGHWAQKVIHPSAELTKEYLVLVDRAPSKAQVMTMMEGVEIDGVHVAPEEVSALEESVRLRVVVAEGKKHEVRLLVAAAGLEVLSLKRVRIGGYRLPRSMRIGEYMQMKPSELRRVTDQRAEQSERSVSTPGGAVRASSGGMGARGSRDMMDEPSGRQMEPSRPTSRPRPFRGPRQS